MRKTCFSCGTGPGGLVPLVLVDLRSREGAGTGTQGRPQTVLVCDGCLTEPDAVWRRRFREVRADEN